MTVSGHPNHAPAHMREIYRHIRAKCSPGCTHITVGPELAAVPAWLMMMMMMMSWRPCTLKSFALFPQLRVQQRELVINPKLRHCTSQSLKEFQLQWLNLPFAIQARMGQGHLTQPLEVLVLLCTACHPEADEWVPAARDV